MARQLMAYQVPKTFALYAAFPSATGIDIKSGDLSASTRRQRCLVPTRLSAFFPLPSRLSHDIIYGYMRYGKFSIVFVLKTAFMLS
jgi:hypothetical protein